MTATGTLTGIAPFENYPAEDKRLLDMKRTRVGGTGSTIFQYECQYGNRPCCGTDRPTTLCQLRNGLDSIGRCENAYWNPMPPLCTFTQTPFVAVKMLTGILVPSLPCVNGHFQRIPKLAFWRPLRGLEGVIRQYCEQPCRL